MAISAAPFGAFLIDLLTTVTGDTIKVALLTSAFTANVDTPTSYADVIGNEVNGAGYTAGGNTLSGFNATYDATTKTATLAANSTTWTTLTATTRYAIVYRDTGTAATSRLIGLIDFGSDRSYNAEPFELSFSSGIATIGML